MQRSWGLGFVIVVPVGLRLRSLAPGGELAQACAAASTSPRGCFRTLKLATARFFGDTPDGSLRIPVVTDFHVEGRVD